jgi:hypothetical protein
LVGKTFAVGKKHLFTYEEGNITSTHRFCLTNKYYNSDLLRVGRLSKYNKYLQTRKIIKQSGFGAKIKLVVKL